MGLRLLGSDKLKIELHQKQGDAYYSEIQRRMAIQSEVDRELLKSDLKKLKALRSKVKFEDLLDKIDEEIKTIELLRKIKTENKPNSIKVKVKKSFPFLSNQNK